MSYNIIYSLLNDVYYRSNITNHYIEKYFYYKLKCYIEDKNIYIVTVKYYEEGIFCLLDNDAIVALLPNKGNTIYECDGFIFTEIKYCKGMIINDNYLERCKNTVNDKYCDKHIKIYENKEHKCMICQNNVCFTTDIPFHCNHWIHKTCFISHEDDKCLFCKTKLNREEINYFFNFYNNNKVLSQIDHFDSIVTDYCKKLNA